MRLAPALASILLLCGVPLAGPAEHPFQDPDRAAEERIPELRQPPALPLLEALAVLPGDAGHGIEPERPGRDAP
jgi:hypothetical protein